MNSKLQSVKTSIVQEYTVIPVKPEAITKLINCIDNLDRNAASNDDDKTGIIANFLEDISSLIIDTEMSEYIASKMEEATALIDIDCSDQIYSWLYGADLADLLLKNTPQKPLMEFVRSCKECGTDFKFEISEIDNSIPDYWRVFKCNNCLTANIVSLIGGIKRFNFQNCTFEKSYNKKDYLENDIQKKIDQKK